MSYVPCHCLPQEASLIQVKQQTEQNILNCYIYLNGNENSQNIPLIGEGWSSGGGAAAKPADQDNSWKVHAKVPDTVAGAQKLKILYDIV